MAANKQPAEAAGYGGSAAPTEANYNQLEPAEKIERFCSDRAYMEEHGYEAIHLACDKGDLEMVKLILDTGVSVFSLTTGERCGVLHGSPMGNCWYTRGDPMTALQVASKSGKRVICELLIGYGLDPHEKHLMTSDGSNKKIEDQPAWQHASNEELGAWLKAQPSPKPVGKTPEADIGSGPWWTQAGDSDDPLGNRGIYWKKPDSARAVVFTHRPETPNTPSCDTAGTDIGIYFSESATDVVHGLPFRTQAIGPVFFPTEADFFKHREKHGFPRDLSRISTLEAAQLDKGVAVDELFKAMTVKWVKGGDDDGDAEAMDAGLKQALASLMRSPGEFEVMVTSVAGDMKVIAGNEPGDSLLALYGRVAVAFGVCRGAVHLIDGKKEVYAHADLKRRLDELGVGAGQKLTFRPLLEIRVREGMEVQVLGVGKPLAAAYRATKQTGDFGDQRGRFFLRHTTYTPPSYAPTITWYAAETYEDGMQRRQWPAGWVMDDNMGAYVGAYFLPSDDGDSLPLADWQAYNPDTHGPRCKRCNNNPTTLTIEWV